MATEATYEKLAGEPTLIATKGAQYEVLGEAILRASTALQSIADSDMTSEALGASQSLARDVKADVERAANRYAETGAALVTYAESLRLAQTASAYPATRIAEIETALVTARSTLSRRREEYRDATTWFSDATPDEVDDAKARRDTAVTAVADLEASLVAYQGEWQEAFDARATAAQVAAEQIKEVTEGDGANGLNDTFWDKAQVIIDVLKTICDIAALLSVFLAWVPILGQILLVLAAIGALIAILDAAIKLAKGEGSLLDLGIAIGMAVLTMYGGKLIGFAAKSLKGTASARIVRQVGRGQAFRVPAVKAGAALAKKGKQHTSLLTKLTSPFARSNKQAAIFREFKKSFAKSLSSFKKGKSSFGDLLKGGKGALGQAGSANLKNIAVNPIKLDKLLKIDADLGDLRDIVKAFKGVDGALKPETISTFHKLMAANVGVNVAIAGKAGYDVFDKVGSGDYSGASEKGAKYGGSHLDGGLGKVGSIPAAGHGLVDLVNGGVDDLARVFN